MSCQQEFAKNFVRVIIWRNCQDALHEPIRLKGLIFQLELINSISPGCSEEF